MSDYHSPLTIGRVSLFTGSSFVETLQAVRVEEDWSGCRSPSRAKRRHAMGIRTRMVRRERPSCYFVEALNCYYIHPKMMKGFKERLGYDLKRNQESSLYKGIMGADFAEIERRALANEYASQTTEYKGATTGRWSSNQPNFTEAERPATGSGKVPR